MFIYRLRHIISKNHHHLKQLFSMWKNAHMEVNVQILYRAVLGWIFTWFTVTTSNNDLVSECWSKTFTLIKNYVEDNLIWPKSNCQKRRIKWVAMCFSQLSATVFERLPAAVSKNSCQTVAAKRLSLRTNIGYLLRQLKATRFLKSNRIALAKTANENSEWNNQYKLSRNKLVNANTCKSW